MAPGTIYTIGHSTHSYPEFLEMLRGFEIQLLADVRNFPGSRKFPHFNSDVLQSALADDHIAYIHFKALGGRRKPDPESHNTAWRHPAFRGYADYMETAQFAEAVQRLEETALKTRVAIMCSEAVWWRCHRSMISDYLKSRSWQVLHIMNASSVKEHPYTAPARIENGALTYKALF